MNMNLEHYHNELFEKNKEYRVMSILKDILEKRMMDMLSERMNEDILESMKRTKELREYIKQFE